jgi:hypothetical protein
MIAMLVGEQNPIELFKGDTALFETQDDLARAQSAVDENFTMIGRDECAISGTATAEHGETEHAPYLAAMLRDAQINSQDRQLNCAIGQGENALFLGVVIERTKSTDLIKPAHSVERIEILRVTRRQLSRFQITAA